MTQKKIKRARKLKIVIGLFILLAGALFYIVFHYGFDPELLTQLSFYINLANPSVRIIRVEEGLRKEQVANIMVDKLGWNQQQKDDFLNIHLALNTTNLEGRYFPKTYLIDKDQDPGGVSAAMFHEFSTQVSKIKKPKSKQIINEDTALKIASIIQREAQGKHDMKLISGIIWNRIWIGMKLQMDATLQYAKGSEEAGWWKQVHGADRKIISSYNTYLHAGLPPGAIANPGLSAIDAAYNPQKTDCLFYLHDKNGNIHCSKTYEEHKQNIQTYY